MGCTPRAGGAFAENPPLMEKRCLKHNQLFIPHLKLVWGRSVGSAFLPLHKDFLLPSSGAEVGRNSDRFPWAEPCPG